MSPIFIPSCPVGGDLYKHLANMLISTPRHRMTRSDTKRGSALGQDNAPRYLGAPGGTFGLNLLKWYNHRGQVNALPALQRQSIMSIFFSMSPLPTTSTSFLAPSLLFRFLVRFSEEIGHLNGANRPPWDEPGWLVCGPSGVGQRRATNQPTCCFLRDID